MLQTRHQFIGATFVASDLLATLAAFFAGWFLRYQTEIFATPAFSAHTPEFSRYLRLLPFILILWPLVFYFHGLYQMRRGRTRSDEGLTVVVAVVLATVLLSAVTAWYHQPGYARADGTFEVFNYSRSFLATFAVLDLFFVFTSRALIRGALRRRRLRGINLQRILVVGAGALGQDVTRKILAHQEFGFQAVGFLDDDPAKIGEEFLGVPVLGPVDEIDEVLERERIDQVFLALPIEAHRKTLALLDTVGRECVEVKLVPDILQFVTLRAALEDLDGTPVINLTQVPLKGWYTLAKRLMDICIASLALAALLPLLPFVALAIWLDDRGPIFYRQERMGLDGKPFHILKFRSMRVDAESSTGPVWAVKDDPRRTIVGGFLRRWSLDELPQLWNVVKGDMSIVGPRPERPAFVREFKGQMPQYMLRHKVKSGITGWAQVHGWRGNTSIKKRLQYDLYYIENWSLKLDFKILWLTLRHGLRHTNAY